MCWRLAAASALLVIGISVAGCGGRTHEHALAYREVTAALHAAGVTRYYVAREPAGTPVSGQYVIFLYGPRPGARYILVRAWGSIEGAANAFPVKVALRQFPRENRHSERICNVWLLTGQVPLPPKGATLSAAARQHYARIASTAYLVQGKIAEELRRRCVS